MVPENTRKADRFLGEVHYPLSAIHWPLAGGTYRQTGYSYPVWMAQRLLDALRQSPENDQRIVGDWLAAVGGSSVLHLDLPRVTRVGLAAARIA